jgi:hypothetical protein
VQPGLIQQTPEQHQTLQRQQAAGQVVCVGLHQAQPEEDAPQQIRSAGALADLTFRLASLVEPVEAYPPQETGGMAATEI